MKEFICRICGEWQYDTPGIHEIDAHICDHCADGQMKPRFHSKDQAIFAIGKAAEDAHYQEAIRRLSETPE